MVLDIRCTRDVSIGTLLLARGRDRLETKTYTKRFATLLDVSYSLGDAIDWKLFLPYIFIILFPFLLLARGRDRLETIYFYSDDLREIESPTR